MATKVRGKATIQIGLDDKALKKGLKSASDNFKKLGANITKIGAGLTAAGTAITAPILLATKAFAQAGDQLDKISKRTGVSVEALSRLGFAAEQSGAGVEDLQTGLRGMARSINNLERGLSTAKDSFEDLDISLEDIKGLSPEQQFRLIADRIAGISDPTKKAAVSMEIFGRAGQKLIPLINEGAAGIAKLSTEADKFGITISKEEADKAAELTDAFNLLRKSLLGLKVAIGADVADIFIGIFKGLSKGVSTAAKFVKENKGLIPVILTAGSAVTALGIAITGIGAGLIATGFLLSSLTAISGALSTALALVGSAGSIAFGLLTSPITLLLGAIAAITAKVVFAEGEFSKLAGTVKGDLSRAFDAAKATLDLFKDALLTGDFATAFKIAFLGIKLVALTAFDSILKKWEEVKTGFLIVINDIALSAENNFLKIKSGFLTVLSEMIKASGNFVDNFVEGFKVVLFEARKIFVKLKEQALNTALEIALISDEERKERQAINTEEARLDLQRIQREEQKRPITQGLTDELEKSLTSAIDSAEKRIREIESGAASEGDAQALLDAEEDSKRQRAETINLLKAQLGELRKQIAKRKQQGETSQDQANTLKNNLPSPPKFAQLAEAGSAEAIKLLSGRENPMLKEQRKTNDELGRLRTTFEDIRKA